MGRTSCLASDGGCGRGQVLGAGRQVAGHTDRAARIQPDVQDVRRRVVRRRRTLLSCDRKRRKASLSTSRTCSTARGCESPSASPRWARASATRSRRAISRFARASSSRWRSSSFAIPNTSTRVVPVLARSPHEVVHRPGPGRASDSDSASTTPTNLATTRRVPPISSTLSRSCQQASIGELEGIAHRGDFDLRSHMEGKLDPHEPAPGGGARARTASPSSKGSGRDLTYRDDLTNERFTPHVIEPSAGADRATLAFLCEAYYRGRGARRERQACRPGW